MVVETTIQRADPPGISFYNMGRAHCLVEVVLLELLFRRSDSIDSKYAVRLSVDPSPTDLPQEM